MEIDNFSDKSQLESSSAAEKVNLESKVKNASDVSERPGTFRYSDANLGGEICTNTEAADSLQPVANAQVFRPDGTTETVGTARYTVDGNEAKVYPASVTAPNYGVESALLDEVGDRARVQGASKLTIFTPNGDSAAMTRWTSHGFQPAAEQNNNPAGLYLEKLL